MRKRKIKKISLLIILIIFLILTPTYLLINNYYQNKIPNIKLIGEKEVTLNYGEKFNDKGAKAELFNKNISKNIIVKNNIDYTKPGTYEIEYIIKSKNRKYQNKIIRTIRIVDKEIPSITLTNNNEKNLYVGDTYQEDGYIASDNVDGDISSKVKITNNVDNSKTGKYEILYEVYDSSNNYNSAKRTINIIEKPKPKQVPTNNKDNVTTNKVKTQSGTGTGISILMYHYFYDKTKGEIGKDSNYMEIHDFENQIKYLTENNYYFPTWDEIYQYVLGKIDLPKKSVVITIDDGHASLFSHAIPILNKYNARATAFIITSKSAANKFKNYQSETINFQSHTHDMHKAGCTGGRGGLFRCIKFDDGLKDLNTSISILGSNDALAYPFGDITDNTLNITKKAGFKVAVTIKYGRAKKGMDPLQLPRIRMSKGVSIESFKKTVA